ncbi:hypothetical protein ACIBEK_07415 [Nocardia fusca]|uniref:hypothetical protein n=1 Tax=Nocardia fusca TaxID=941183 RepID=UPI0037A03CB9
MHPETAAALDIVARQLGRLGAEIFSGAEDSVTGKWPHPDDVTAKDFDTPA